MHETDVYTHKNLFIQNLHKMLETLSTYEMLRTKYAI